MRARWNSAPPGAAEVADLRVIDTELVVDVVDEFRNEEIQIGVALPVPVRRHVERHAVEPRLKIGAVVEIEAAHEVLVRLAVAGVLRDDHPGHGLEQLALARDRAKAQIGGADASFGGRRRDAAQVVDAARDLDGVEGEAAGGVRLCLLCADRFSRQEPNGAGGKEFAARAAKKRIESLRIE